MKKEEKKEEGEFEQQRQATIAEALQAKEEKTKTFGGGQKQVHILKTDGEENTLEMVKLFHVYHRNKE